MTTKRIRLITSRGEEAKYLSHLDVVRVWIRACRRSGLTLKYSEGFSPRPKITIAAPLPVGVMARADFIEIECEDLPRTVMNVLPRCLPAGFMVHEAMEIDLAVPALQTSVQKADYEVNLSFDGNKLQAQCMIDDFMAKEEVIFTRQKENSSKEFNIRTQVYFAEIISLEDGILKLKYNLMCSQEGSGRADEVALSMGFARPAQILRTKLYLTV